MAVRSLICRTLILYMYCCSNNVCRQADKNNSTARSQPVHTGESRSPMNSRNRLGRGTGREAGLYHLGAESVSGGLLNKWPQLFPPCPHFLSMWESCGPGWL